jgi:sialic acid synthase SpsE
MTKKRKSINISGKIIGDDYPPFLIAEIGLNHNKDISLAKKIIKSAKESGADAVKFQTFITEQLISKKSKAFSLFKSLELSKNDFKEISYYCKKQKIIFFSTPFAVECVDWLEEINVPCYKIASSDLNYTDLLITVAKTKKPVILSTGISNFKTIKKAISVINKNGNDNIIIFHTISKYPPEYKDMNLRMIEYFRSKFNYPIGFSDHTIDNTMSLIARALGASIFERHFTIDKKLKGPDHSISLEPGDFLDLKNKLKNIDEALVFNKDTRSDMIIEKGAKRGLFAKEDIKKGQKINKDLISIIRPVEGLTANDLSAILGKECKKDILKGESFDSTCF